MELDILVTTKTHTVHITTYTLFYTNYKNAISHNSYITLHTVTLYAL
jgi:hypothetical protein